MSVVLKGATKSYSSTSSATDIIYTVEKECVLSIVGEVILRSVVRGNPEYGPYTGHIKVKAAGYTFLSSSISVEYNISNPPKSQTIKKNITISNIFLRKGDKIEAEFDLRGANASAYSVDFKLNVNLFINGIELE